MAYTLVDPQMETRTRQVWWDKNNNRYRGFGVHEIVSVPLTAIQHVSGRFHSIALCRYHMITPEMQLIMQYMKMEKYKMENYVYYRMFKVKTSFLFGCSTFWFPEQFNSLFKTNIGARVFYSCAPSLLNRLPLSVRSAISVGTFKKHLKTRLFDLAFPS